MYSQEDQNKLYRLSEEKMEEFQKTLRRFTETLQKKKVFSKLGITLRDPSDFDLEYVLSIASRISEWRDKSEDVNACVRFARKCCQKATKNKEVLTGLISLAPTDTYGSLISGGFTFVLAVRNVYPETTRFKSSYSINADINHPPGNGESRKA